MIINHNLMANNAIRNMNINSNNASKSMSKLSSGLRINSAADDAAGLAISEKMRGQIRGLNQASANAQDGISMIQTAEGGLNETHSILQRMRELSVQASNGTATDDDRAEIQKEVSQLKSEIDRISNDTEFNTKKLLNGNMSAAKAAQGTKANSVTFDRSAVDATAGTEDGANAINVATIAADAGVQGSVQAGAAFDLVGGGVKIVTGMNDQVKITVGSNSSTITMDGTATGKSYASLDDVISNLNSKIAADDALKGKVTFAKDSSGTKLTLKAVNVGDSVAIGEATTGQSALSALGFKQEATGVVDAPAATEVAVDSVDMSGASARQFTVTIGGVTKSINLADTNGGATAVGTSATEDLTSQKTAIEEHLNYAFFGDKDAGLITVGDDGSDHLTLTLDPTISTSGIKVEDVGTQAGTSVIFDSTGSVAGATGSTVTNSTTYGKAATSASTIGTVIAQDVNDRFNISVDGGTAQTIQLTAKSYASRAELVSEINNQISANGNLAGKVSATLDTDNTIKFVSASTGTSSSVVISKPTDATSTAALDESKASALSAIGYEGNIQTKIEGTTWTANQDLSTAKDQKFKLEIGAKTYDIDFGTGNSTTINSNTSITAARDAIQNAIDDTVGENIVKVDIENGKLTFTSLAATNRFAIKDDTINASTATMTGASKLLGVVSSNGEIASDLTNAATVLSTTASNNKFQMTVGLITKVIDLGDSTLGTDALSGAAENQARVVTAMQKALDSAWGANTFKVTTSTTNLFNIESTLNDTDVTIGADVAANYTGGAALFGDADGFTFTRTANDSLTLSNTTTDGTAASAAGSVQATTKLVNLTDTDGSNLGLTAGNVITISGTKDGSAFSSTLNVTDTTTMTELIDKMNSMSAFAGGTVSLNDQSGKIEFVGANGKVNDISNLKLSAQVSATDTTTIDSFNNKAGSFIKTQTAQDVQSGHQTTVHIGANQGQTTTLDINDMSSKALSIDKVDVSTKDGAEVAITLIDNATAAVSSERSKLGALQNRLEHTINNLGTSSENLTSAESRIRDVDMASEMSNYSKNNILSQAAQAMLAQANQQPQQVLQLLR